MLLQEGGKWCKKRNNQGIPVSMDTWTDITKWKRLQERTRRKTRKTQVKNYTLLNCTCGCAYVNLLIFIDFLLSSLVGPTPKSD